MEAPHLHDVRRWVLILFFCLASYHHAAGQAEGQTSPGQMVDEPIHPVNIPRREKDFQGMLEYKKEDELKLIKNLILGKAGNLKQGYNIVGGGVGHKTSI